MKGGTQCVVWVNRKVSGGISKLTGLLMDEIQPTPHNLQNQEALDWMVRDGDDKGESELEGEREALESIGRLFELPFFAPLVCKHSSDASIVRLSGCSRGLRCILAPEVESIREKRIRQGLASILPGDKGPDALQFLLCLTFAFMQSCVHLNLRPLEVYLTRMAYGPNGYHNDAVGYTNIGQIFDFIEEGEDSECIWF